MKHSHYVTSRQRILLGTGVTLNVGVSVDSSSFDIRFERIITNHPRKSIFEADYNDDESQ